MTKQLSSRIRLVYGAVLSASIAVAAVCLMAACVQIYSQGGRPFSREAVAQAFTPIALPVYLCLGLTLGGFLLDLFLPEDAAKLTAGRQNALVLKRLHGKTDLDKCGEDLRAAVAAQQRSRSTHRRIRSILLVLSAVVFLAYGMNPANFHQSEINDSMIRAMYVLVPCLAVSFGYALFTAYHSSASMEKEIELLKQAGPEARRSPAPAAESAPGKAKLVRNVLLVLAVILLVYGFCTGGTADVLTKAVNICTECVGLG